MKFDKEKVLQPNTVVHCRTEEQAKELLTWADSIGLKRINGNGYMSNFEWTAYMENTCYYLYDDGVASREFFEKKGFIIHKFEDVVIKKTSTISMDKKYKTRDGKNVRIICTDMKNEYYTVIALVSINENVEKMRIYTKEGSYYYNGNTHDFDLVEIEPIPDKTLVRCWDGNQAFVRSEKFYDSVNNCTFTTDGYRDGLEFQHYEVINPEPKWAKEARKNLRD